MIENWSKTAETKLKFNIVCHHSPKKCLMWLKLFFPLNSQRRKRNKNLKWNWKKRKNFPRFHNNNNDWKERKTGEISFSFCHQAKLIDRWEKETKTTDNDDENIRMMMNLMKPRFLFFLCFFSSVEHLTKKNDFLFFGKLKFRLLLLFNSFHEKKNFWAFFTSSSNEIQELNFLIEKSLTSKIFVSYKFLMKTNFKLILIDELLLTCAVEKEFYQFRTIFRQTIPGKKNTRKESQKKTKIFCSWIKVFYPLNWWMHQSNDFLQP